MNLISVPAFTDNYIWLLEHENQCVIVDPGDASPVLSAIEKRQLNPAAILLTHHHNDHTGGVTALKERFASIPVYGPEETRQKGATQIVHEGGVILLLGSEFSVFSVPGHTAGHLAYYSAPYLFCGDTLFSAGCGRIFEGTPEQMWGSVSRLAQLPDETLVCCAHEYTQSNLEFAHHIWPEETDIRDYLLKIRQLREKGSPSLPSRLGVERRINIFLRCNDIDLKRKFSNNMDTNTDWQIFAHLRTMKNQF
ncbi:hydroxyacylglutathione hydrolase [Musicola paradisiaca]|uniref:Hydroxyacylglutathione hydrolase n=1 Tax=Musicola paradisiaca (strain Ech703) TaxID=579405 RepID=C6CB90_MUSP7|nr:hydroxyacylglutathione hydrolase [Musicola paradisiaca]ACS86618.1 hydroxyacylglutathione hydrolase [Musicola paradisiaca Ech703]